MSEQGEEVCKYCHCPEDEDEGGSLVTPCACRTPLHQRCLFQWICTKRCDACEICQQRWQGQLQVPPDSLLEVLAQSQGDAAVREAITALVAAMNANALARLAGLEQQVMRSVHAMRHVQQQLQVLELAGQAHRETIARLQSELAEARREAAHNLAALHAAQQLVDNTPNAAAVDAANKRADKAEADKRALQQVVERSWASGRRPPAPQRPWWQVWAARGSMVAVGALVGAAIGVPIDRRVRRAHRPGCSGRGSRAGGMFEVRAQRAAKG